jgi:hypothetical protein
MKSKENAGVRQVIQEIAKKVLQERSLDVPSVDNNVVVDAMKLPSTQVAVKLSEHAVVEMEHKLGPTLLKALNAHLIGVENPSAAAGPAWTTHDVERILEQQEAQLVELQGECMDAVANALQGYYEGLVSIIAHAAHDEDY